VPPKTNQVSSATANPAVSIVKSLLSPSGRAAAVGETMTFRITVTNTGNVTLDTVPLTDTFNSNLLVFANAVPAPTIATTGALYWANIGPLATNSSSNILVSFTAIGGGVGSNTVITTPTSLTGIPVLSAADHVMFTIDVILAIRSEHGTGTRPVGTYTNAYGAILTNYISGLPTFGGTQYVATGWTLSGNDPATGNATNNVMIQTNNAVLTWLWATNYQLTSSAVAGGTVEGATNGFYAADTLISVTATPWVGWIFSGWTGDAVGDTNSQTMNVPMSQARALVAHFARNLGTLTILSEHGKGTPTVGVYTNIFGAVLTNLMTGVETLGGTQYVSTGWTLSGNEPVGGSNTTATLTLTNNAVLTWLWRTNYYLTLVAQHGVITNGSTGWKPAGSLYGLAPLADFGFVFDHWVINGQSAGVSATNYVTMNQAKTVEAVFVPTFIDVTSQISWNTQWVFNPRLGYFTGTLTLSNRADSAKSLLVPVWYEVQSNQWHWLRFPSGFDTYTGLYYADLSESITNQLPGIGDHDLALDPGETVTVTGIQLMGRRTPINDLVVAIWADPPGSLAYRTDTDGDGVSDEAESIAGTDPANSNSFFQIRLGPDYRCVQWDGQRNRIYQVQMATNLCQGFIPIGSSLEGLGVPATYTLTPQSLGGQPVGTVFYQVDVRVKEVSK
jgi:uncharacterized repeat protein (TIGR01451 family)